MSASSRKPARLASKELLLSPQEAQCGQETPMQRASDEGERSKERNRREEEGRGGGREMRLTVKGKRKRKKWREK